MLPRGGALNRRSVGVINGPQFAFAVGKGVADFYFFKGGKGL